MSDFCSEYVQICQAGMRLALTLTARQSDTAVEQVTAVSPLCLWLEAYPASWQVFYCASSGQESCFAI